MPHLEFISSTSQFQSTYLTSSNIITIEYQYFTYYMVQIWLIVKPIIQALLLSIPIYAIQFAV